MATPLQTKDRQDENLNPGARHASDLVNAERQGSRYADDDADRNTRTTQPRDPAQTNIQAAKDAEQTAGAASDDHRINVNRTAGGSTGKKQKSFWKRIAPTALIGGGAAGGLFATLFSISGGLLPFTMESVFGNATNYANNSVLEKHINVMSGRLEDDVRNKVSICNTLVSFRCQLKTLSPKAIEKYKKAGFTFGDETPAASGKRVAFSSITFPSEVGGATAHNAKELRQIVDRNLAAYSKFLEPHNPTRAIFFGDHFRNVLGKLNLTKQKKIVGDTPEQANESYEKTLESGDSPDPNVTSVAPDVDENATDAEKAAAEAAKASGNDTASAINSAIGAGQKVQSISVKTTDPLLPAQLACMTFNTAGFINSGVQTIKILRYASFAMALLTGITAMRLGDSTAAESGVITDTLAPSEFPEKIEDPATGEMIDNPNIGKSAAESEAFKVVFYGDDIDLSDLAKRFFLAGGILGVLQDIMTWLDRNVGRENIKTGCSLVNNTVVTIISFLAAPVLSSAFYVAGQLLPLDQWAAAIVNNVIESLAGADLTTDIKGVDAGNVLFIGTALVMGQSAMQFGLKPGALAAIERNMSANNEIQQKEIALKRDSISQFDITDPYSFTGRLSMQLQQYLPSSTSFASIGNIFSMIPDSLQKISGVTANAAFNQPLTGFSENRFKQCDDPTYEELGINPDIFCVPYFVPFESTELPDPVYSYMKDNAQIDIDGKARSGSQYEKYLKYCNQRDDPWGSTSVPIEEQSDGVDWYTGKKCLEDTRENQMFSDQTGYNITVANFEQTIELGADESETITHGSITEAMIAGYNYLKSSSNIASQGESYAQ